MAENNGAPSLDEILRTLANLAPPQNNAQQSQPQPYDIHSLPNQGHSLQNSLSGTRTPEPVIQNRPHDPRLVGRPLHAPSPSRPQPQARSSTPSIDASTVTEWKHGLRCINKISAQDPTFATSIQKLIKEQERNVKDWDNGRQRLIEEQKSKRENEITQRAAVSLPGLLDNTPLLRTSERENEELDQYYQKVHRASRQMEESHSAELKRLGVPFFGLKQNMLRSDDSASASSNGDGEEKSSDGKITPTQLRELKRKMLNHLLELSEIAAPKKEQTTTKHSTSP